MRQETKLVQRGIAVAMLGMGVVALGAPIASVAPAPPSVVTGAVGSVEPTSAVVTGTVDPHAVATTWYIEYGPNTTFVSDTPAKSAGAGDTGVAISEMISGLAAATSYDYRVVGTNSSGRTFGATGSFITTAPPVVSTGPAGNVTAAAATMSGSVDPEALTTSWYFEYSIGTSYDKKTTTEHLVASPNPTTVSISVSDLHPESTYHYRLIASNSAGKTYGHGLTFSTGLPVTLNAAASTVVYGAATTISGATTNGLAGERVTLESEPFNQSYFTGFATVVTGTGGAWSYIVQPAERTTYEAVVSDGTSSPLVLSVTPAVSLTVRAKGRLRTQVVAAVSFADHVMQLQILSHGIWATWKHVRLNASGVATFTTRLPTGIHTVRMAIGPSVPGIDQAAPGYLAGFSRAIRR